MYHVSLRSFQPTSPAGVTEHHALISITDITAPVAAQFAALNTAVAELTARLQATPVFRRYFLSDAVNQRQFIPDSDAGSVSIVGQPPLNGAKVALWIYMATDVHVICTDNAAVMSHNGYSHLYHTQMQAPEQPDSFAETDTILRHYAAELDDCGCTLLENCIRTWIYVHDIDSNYAGMVQARRQFFEEHGLTPQTGYIASTGIEGRSASRHVRVLIDACGLLGAAPAQLRHLHAPTHLNPTHEYGVTFERGASIDYGDRRHIFISGTASIDNTGNVVHTGDVLRQTHRTLENISALLADADATTADIMFLLVYLRDIADCHSVEQYLATCFPEIPRLMLLAPVCRPQWLVEMECIAIKTIEKSNSFTDF
ncbi:MAG: hypothetical protein LBR06_07895 [Bacteroidales bacterium]|jgi:enamine deaminase RidA (YjgF/YER057c/UK114 family)|nr:hypothetical protein [Bacteroidales bacterium]